MTMMIRTYATIAAAFIIGLLGGPVSAQTPSGSSCPYIAFGSVLTAAQWNYCFQIKQDTLGYVPVNKAGDVMLGPLVTAIPSISAAGFNLPHGVAPTSPVNGDLWTTTSGLFVQINGATIGPLASASGSPFVGQQTTQGLTTTQPGWYAKITGDTNPRSRIGTNGTDVGSLAFGPGNAALDAFIERQGAASIRFGAPDAAAPVAQLIGVQNVATGTSNTAGADFTIAGSRGTGTGIGGCIFLQTAAAGSTGSTQNALANAFRVCSTGGAAVGALSPQGTGTLNAAAFYSNNVLIVDSAQNITGASATVTGALTTGTNGGTAGQIVARGSTSGSATVTAQAAAGAVALLWPTTSGTIASSGTAPIVVSATTGAISCPTCNTTGANVSSVTAGDGSLTISPTAGAVVASVGLVPLGKGGTGQTTANAARQSSGLNVYGDQGTGYGNVSQVLANTDRLAYTNAAFTASRTWTLPAANVTGQPYTVKIADTQGTVTGVNTLVISRAGADTINGGGTTVTISSANGGYECSSDGSSKWSCLSMGAASAGGVTSITAGTGLSGGTITTSGTIAVALSNLTNSIGADVSLSNTANYFDGPSVAQGTSGTWYASGTVTLVDTVGAAQVYCKLWDGTTVIASGDVTISVASLIFENSLSGVITSPAANIRISCRDINSTSGKILFNTTGNSKDSTVTAVRING